MKNYAKKGCVFLLMAVLSAPLMADDKHDKWIDVLSIDWGSAQVGATTRLADGNYKTDRGQFLIVRGGKVAEKGPDYRRFKDDGTPLRASVRKSGNESSAIGTLRATDSAGIEPDEIDAPAPRSAPSVQPDPIGAPKTRSGRKPGIEHEDIGAPKAEGAHKPGGGTTGQSRRRGDVILDDVTMSQGKARELDKSSPKLQEANAGGQHYSLQQMMVKLRPRGATPVATKPGGGTSPADKVAAPPADSRYEIADCGTNASPMICCHNGEGDTGSTCNMFKMLCTNAGGTAQGDGTDATCSDWP